MSDRYRAVAMLLFVGAALAGLTVGGAARFEPGPAPVT